MANTKSTQHEIPLTSELNLNKFKADIKPYEGFNERNSPYYGGALSPLYEKDLGTLQSGAKYYKGHKYHVTQNGSNAKLYQDNNKILDFSSEQFIKEYLKDRNGFENKEVIDYYNDEQYIERIYSDRVNLHIGTKTITINDANIVSSYFTKVGTDFYCFVNDYVYSSNNSFQDEKLDESGFYKSKYKFIKKIGNTVFAQLGGTIKDLTNHRYAAFKTPTVDLSYRETNIASYYFICSGTGVWFFSKKLEETTFTPKYMCRNLDDFTKMSQQLEDLIGTSIPLDLSDLAGEIVFPILKFKSSGFNGCVYKQFQNRTNENPDKAIAALNKTYDYVVKQTPLSFQWENVTYNFTEIDFSIGAATDNMVWQDLDNPISINIDDNQYFPQYCVQLKGLEYQTTTEKELIYFWRVCDVSIKTNIDGSIRYVSPCGLIMPAGQPVGWMLLANNTGEITGISYNNTGYTVGTLLTDWGSIDTVKNVYADETGGVRYYSVDKKDWVIIKTDNTLGLNEFTIIDDFIVVNTKSYYNCINLKTLKNYHWASDWNNRCYKGLDDGAVKIISSDTPYTIASGQNVNYLTDAPSSLKSAPITVYKIRDNQYKENAPYADALDGNFVALYKNSKYIGSISKDTYELFIESYLQDTTYPGDAVRYNIPLLFDVIQGPLDTTLVNFGSNVSFFLIYYDNINRYQYYSSSITEFEDFFVIQGQSYGIGRNKIYSLLYANGAIQSSTAVTPIEGLIFIGNTIYNAYFYSPTARAIYSFGADNSLQIFTQADTITGVTGSAYIVSTGSIILGTPDCVYVINERFGIYRLNDIDNFDYACQMNDGTIVLVTDDNKAYQISYEPQTNYVKQNVILDTSFYGAGSNVVSVNDCWYIRVTDTERGEGEIKLAVSTLTDVGRTTEERTFKIKAKDWDELTDTVYIRFQPKLQRAVGVSLHIESPFKVGYIGVGATPETLQLNRGTI